MVRSTPTDGWLAIHIGATFIMGWWALMLFTGSTTFDVGTSFDAMAALGGEILWAWFFLVICVFGAYALTTRDMVVRRFSSALVSIGHIWVATLSVMAGGMTTGTGTYAVIAWLAVGRLVQQCSEEQLHVDRI